MNTGTVPSKSVARKQRSPLAVRSSKLFGVDLSLRRDAPSGILYGTSARQKRRSFGSLASKLESRPVPGRLTGVAASTLMRTSTLSAALKLGWQQSENWRRPSKIAGSGGQTLTLRARNTG